MPLTRTLTIALVAAIAVGGCATVKNTQGYIPDEELVASVQPGIDNKQSVEQTLGEPTITAQWDDNTWYYITRKTGHRAFLRPKPQEQDILVVHFAEDGTVRGVENRGLEQVVPISPNSDKTRTAGRKDGLLEALFGNIGTVGAAGGGGPPQ